MSIELLTDDEALREQGMTQGDKKSAVSPFAL